MSFDNPGILCLLLTVFVYLPFVIARYRKGRKGAGLFAAAAPSGERQSFFRELRLRMVISDIFFLFFFCFLVIALAGPRWGVKIVADYRRGVDVILAFDLSRSMNVRDCSPLSGNRNPPPAARSGGDDAVSRLERGAGIARDIAAALADIRFGAAIGKGRGILAVPLTYDSETVLSFLDTLDSLAITGRGTNLESLIDAASASFQDSMPSRRGIILFTDGETHTGSFQAAVEKARRAGIILCAVGLGTEEGGFVPVEKSGEAPEGFLLSGSGGKPVISALRDEVLRAGAEKTGGVYIDGSRGDAAPVLAGFINTLSAESRLSGHRREANPRWRIFVLAAMVCIAGARGMGFSRRKRRWDRAVRPREYFSPGGPEKGRKDKKGGGARLPLVLFCLAVLSITSCAKVEGKLLVMEGNFFNTRGFYTEAISSYLRALEYEDSAPYAEYGLASAYFSLEESSAALERYQSAENELAGFKREEHGELRYRIQYNMGIIHFEKGEYEEAAAAFREALKVDSSRIDAKRNLELSLLTINRMNSPQAAPQGRTENSRGAADGSGSILFEYLRQKEQEQWKSREWSGEDDYSGPDY